VGVHKRTHTRMCTWGVWECAHTDSCAFECGDWNQRGGSDLCAGDVGCSPVVQTSRDTSESGDMKATQHVLLHRVLRAEWTRGQKGVRR
jgi:hypothetical protein